MAAVIDAIAQRGFDRTMLDEECSDGDAVLLENFSFLHVVARYRDSFRRKLFVHIAAYVDVEGKRLLNVVHHVDSAGRSPDFESLLTRCAADQGVRNKSGMSTT